MLYTDSSFLTPDDLFGLDAQLEAVAEAERIVLDGDRGIINTVVDECGSYIVQLVQAYAAYPASAGVTAGHMAAVLGPVIGRGPTITLQQIITHDEYGGRLSPIQRWIAYRTVSKAYRAAFNNSRSDQYLEKSASFDADANQAWQIVSGIGLPYTLRPLDRPAAYRRPRCGTWGDVNVSTTSGTTPAGQYEVVITYTGKDWSANTLTAESAPSSSAFVNLPTDGDIVVNITSLSPPTGAIDRLSPCVPQAATGWNIYAGVVGAPLRRQNATPLPIATKIHYFTLSDSLEIVGTGQQRDAYLTLVRSITRG